MLASKGPTKALAHCRALACPLIKAALAALGAARPWQRALGDELAQ